MENTEIKSKRLIKNTLFLYLRMVVVLLISLYTSRIILDNLGVTDFGIYNVVGGVVVMFNVICASFAESTSRFYAYEIGNENFLALNIVFKNSKTIHLGLAIIITIFAEFVGVYLIEHQLTIPEERLYASKIVLHLSIIIFIVKLITIPYRALIIAHERMDFYAIIGLVEVIIKLFVAYILYYVTADRLIWYSILLLLEPLVCYLLMLYYCVKHIGKEYNISNYGFNIAFISKLGSFAGWDSLGAFERIMMEQGLNILINVFFSPIINAARGISFQVRNAVLQFSANFQVAAAPQITKSYASKDYGYLHNVIKKTCKYSFFLLLIPIIPLFSHIDYWLLIWLGKVPEHTALFVRLSLIFILIDSTYEILNQGAKASGDIKKYRIVTCCISLLNLPISYFVLKLGGIPELTIVITSIVGVGVLIAQLILLRRLILLPIYDFLKCVTIRCYPIAAFLLLLVFLEHKIVIYEEIFVNILLFSFIEVAITLFMVCTFGLTRNEKIYIVELIKKRIK